NTFCGGIGGKLTSKREEENATRRPALVKIMTSLTPARSRKLFNNTPGSPFVSFRDLTNAWLRSFKSFNCESSAARPKFKPDSSAESTRTLNQDSIDLDINCTDST